MNYPKLLSLGAAKSVRACQIHSSEVLRLEARIDGLHSAISSLTDPDDVLTSALQACADRVDSHKRLLQQCGMAVRES